MAEGWGAEPAGTVTAGAVPAGTGAAGEIRAAGAVVCRRAAGGDEVSLIHRIKYGDWTFPKGKLEPGEDVLEAAVQAPASCPTRRSMICSGRRYPRRSGD